MKRSFSSLLRMGHNRERLFKNFLSLSVLQSLNYLLPLLVMPILMQALGVATFGLLSFVQAFIQYFVIVIDYGFDLSGVQQISQNREDKGKVQEIVTHILCLKIIFFLVCLVVLVALVTFVPVFEQNQLLFLLAYGVTLGQLLMPIWFFQGMEQMKYVTIIHLVSKIIYASLIALLIRQPDDVLLVPVLQSVGILVAGGVSLSLLWRNFQLKPGRVTLAGLKHQLREGWFVFISNVSISAYTISNTFFLGLLAGNTITGYYSAAEKIVRAVQSLFIPVSQTLFPYLSKMRQESEERVIIFLRKMARFTFLGAGALSVSLFFAAPLVVQLVMDERIEQVVITLRIISALPLVVCLSNVFGIQGMLNLGFRKQFFIILCIASLFNIALVPYIAEKYLHTGVASLLLVTEGLVTVMMYFFLRWKRISLL